MPKSPTVAAALDAVRGAVDQERGDWERIHGNLLADVDRLRAENERLRGHIGAALRWIDDDDHSWTTRLIESKRELTAALSPTGAAVEVDAAGSGAQIDPSFGGKDP